MMSSSGTITSRDRDQDSDSENEELSSDEREIKVPSLKISLKTPEAESSVCLSSEDNSNRIKLITSQPVGLTEVISRWE